MIPKEIAFLPYAIKHRQHKAKGQYFIYFLYNKDKLRYVGKTTLDPSVRAAAHRDKKFTDIYYFIVTRSTYSGLGHKLIAEYSPLYNYNGLSWKRQSRLERRKKRERQAFI